MVATSYISGQKESKIKLWKSCHITKLIPFFFYINISLKMKVFDSLPSWIYGAISHGKIKKNVKT